MKPAHFALVMDIAVALAAALTLFALLAGCATIDPKCCATMCAPQPPCETPRDAGPKGD